MNESINKVIEQFRIEIKTVESQDLNDFNTVENGIKVARNCLQKLRGKLKEGSFEDKTKEIQFFKVQKPFVYSRLKFFAKI